MNADSDSKNHAISDHELELTMAGILLAGVRLSAALVIVGALLFLARHGLEQASYHIFAGEPAWLKSPSAIFAGLFQGKGRSFIELGLICLVLTPVARVAMALVLFARKKDPVYTLITFFVLMILLYSLVSEH